MIRNFGPLSILLLIATGWGATFAITKQALDDISPERLTFWRFLLAGALLLVPAIQKRQINSSTLRRGVALGLLVFGGYWTQTRGLLDTTPSRSAFLTGLAVVLVPFFDRLIFKTRVGMFPVLAAVAAVAGTFVLVGGLTGDSNRGDVLTLLCAICFAAHIVLAAEFSRSGEAFGLAAIQILTVAFCALPLVPLTRPAVFSSLVISTIVITAIFNTALSFVLLMWAQSRVTATEAGIVLAFEPVSAGLTSVFFYDEQVTAALALGGTLILAGMLLSQLRPPQLAAERPQKA